MKRLANPPPRPVALWAATVMVSIQCLPVPIWFLVSLYRSDGDPAVVFFGTFGSLFASVLLACQAVAVFRRHWTGSWMAAAVVGFAFAVPGAFCFFSSPLAIYSLTQNPSPVIWGVAAMGVWSVLATATGGLMLWWAMRLYRWRVLKLRPRPVAAPVEDEL
jgi:hypothetical protein